MYLKHNEEMGTAKHNSIKEENYKKCKAKTIGKNIPNPNIIATLTTQTKRQALQEK